MSVIGLPGSSSTYHSLYTPLFQTLGSCRIGLHLLFAIGFLMVAKHVAERLTLLDLMQHARGQSPSAQSR
jgi:hypothetical protein